MSVSKVLTQSYNDMHRLLRQFLFTLDTIKLVQAHVFPLPDVSEADTHLPVSEIDVRHVQGASALDLAQQSFGHFYFEKGRSPKCPNKVPGILQFQADRAQYKAIQSLLGELNDSKDVFAQTVSSLPRHLRFPTVHTLYPYLVSKQLTRHIHLVDGDLLTASFSLVRKNLSTRVTRDDMTKKLNDWIEAGTPNDYECTNVQIEQAISKISALPEDAYLVRTRDGKIQPVANLRYISSFRQRQASLPFLYLSESPVPIKVKPLQSYSKKRRKEREPRSRTLRTFSILNSIGLVARVP